MSKIIKLSQGRLAIVDDEDFVYLSQFKWCAYTHEGRWYASRSSKNIFGGRKTILMHRVIIKAPAGLQVDHISGDGLDNRRINLRLATRTENVRNSRIRCDNTSGFKGVTWNKNKALWRAQIGADGKMIHLGYYPLPQLAAQAYDRAAIKYFGEFAKTNFKCSAASRSKGA